ncbi:MAG TPA: biotin/lipoyl-binding protein, partial [Candidatus Udaeobacter sp.]
MKTEIPTNGELPISKEREHRRSAVMQDDENRRARPEAEGSSTKDEKQSLFRRPGVIIAAALLAIVGIGYGGLAMFHSFTHESTDDAFIDVHFVSVAPKIAGRVTVVHVDDNQPVKKGDVLVEIDPGDFQVALAQAKANLAKDKATLVQANTNEKRAQDLFAKKVMSAQERDT